MEFFSFLTRYRTTECHENSYVFTLILINAPTWERSHESLTRWIGKQGAKKYRIIAVQWVSKIFLNNMQRKPALFLKIFPTTVTYMKLSACVNKHNSAKRKWVVQNMTTREKRIIFLNWIFGPSKDYHLLWWRRKIINISPALSHMIRPLNHWCLGQDCTFLMVAMDVNEPFRGFTDVLLW